MNQPVTRNDIMQQARGVPASQATTIEQSRAVAEVQAAFAMAAHRPRDKQAAIREALESCKTQEVAERAFFKFPRGGSTVSGESIHLAVELARCWGNITYSIMELDRDDIRGQSEMLAYALDLETNASSRMGFIVPHKRDKRGGAEVLTELRDIYENNANMGARRLRECIFRVLPTYLIEAARQQCFETLQSGTSEKPLAVQLADMVDAFSALGIGRDRIEAKVGPIGNLTGVDLANLKVSYRSIKRSEISADDEFPRVGHEQAAADIRELKHARDGGADADATKPEAKPAKSKPKKSPSQPSDTPPVAGGSQPSSAESEAADDNPSKTDDAGQGATDDNQQGGNSDQWDLWLDDVRQKLMQAETIPDLNSTWSGFRKDLEAAPADIAGSAEASFTTRLKALKEAK